MKKLFVLIFTLTLSTNAFSWVTMSCDKYLDVRSGNDQEAKAIFEIINKTALQWYFLTILTRESMSILPQKGIDALFEYSLQPKQPSLNQIRYMIDKKCRENPTQVVGRLAKDIYEEIFADTLIDCCAPE